MTPRRAAAVAFVIASSAPAFSSHDTNVYFDERPLAL